MIDFFFFFFNDTATTEIYTLSLHDALPISPFMLMTCQVQRDKQPLVPAITHVDGTARQQTVSRATNPKYWGLIHAFERRTGVPIVVNTSFNENEPVVNTPQEAVDCFMRNDMDVLAL